MPVLRISGMSEKIKNVSGLFPDVPVEFAQNPLNPRTNGWEPNEHGSKSPSYDFSEGGFFLRPALRRMPPRSLRGVPAWIFSHKRTKTVKK